MAYLGMFLIISGWVIQFMSKGKEIRKSFVLVYALGVLILVIDYFRNDLNFLSILNLVSFLSALAVFLKIKK